MGSTVKGPLLERPFFIRPCADLARDLLGRHLVRGSVVLRITEVEAYLGPEDSASHARFGRTARNAPMWEAGGLAYVYLCYGIHWMLNVGADEEGRGSAILIRACEPVSGLPVIKRRRGMDATGPALLAGPGKVAQALGLDRAFSGKPFFQPGGLELREGQPPARVLAGPRVGIEYAAEADRIAPLRFADGDSAFVTRPRGLHKDSIGAPQP
ncbi:MAG TPA: DNA-3-methyladenine glycosylase [Holophagaceae bacterium]|nr:DNA-3-methyladenine glycosylase [Holophagaceae bacterium]